MSYRLGMVHDFHWGLIPNFGYSKHHTYSIFIGEKTKIKYIFSLYPGLLEHKQNDSTVNKESTFLLNGEVSTVWNVAKFKKKLCDIKVHFIV